MFINRLAMAVYIYPHFAPFPLPYNIPPAPCEKHPEKPSNNFRHRGDTFPPPRWRFSFTAVTPSRHRGESYSLKARLGEISQKKMPRSALENQGSCKSFRDRLRHRCSVLLCHRQPIYKHFSPETAHEGPNSRDKGWLHKTLA
jgi:hypothetical protein